MLNSFVLLLIRLFEIRSVLGFPRFYNCNKNYKDYKDNLMEPNCSAVLCLLTMMHYRDLSIFLSI